MEMEDRRRGIGEQNVREAEAKPLLSNRVTSGNAPQDRNARGSTRTQRSPGIYDNNRKRERETLICIFYPW